MAPDFLVAEQQHGILNEVVRPTSDGPPATVIQATTGSGRRLWIAYETHLVTAADLAGATSTVARDEHSRPLRLMFGLVCPDPHFTEPADVDLEPAREAALATYRQFLDHEESFGVATSSALPLSDSAVPVSAHGVTSGGATVRSGPGPGFGLARWRWTVAVVLGIVGAIMIVLLLADREEPPVDAPPSSPASPTATPNPTATPGPTTTSSPTGRTS